MQTPLTFMCCAVRRTIWPPHSAPAVHLDLSMLETRGLSSPVAWGPAMMDEVITAVDRLETRAGLPSQRRPWRVIPPGSDSEGGGATGFEPGELRLRPGPIPKPGWAGRGRHTPRRRVWKCGRRAPAGGGRLSGLAAVAGGSRYALRVEASVPPAHR